MPISTIVRKLIRVYGQELIRKKRIETIEGDERVYTYSEPEVLRGQVSQLTGYAESWEMPGLQIRAEYLVTFAPETEIEVGDLLRIGDEWVEVVEKLHRKTGNKTDFIECLCRRREAA
ncbi:MAG: hypothetical protein DRN15_09020 [Thermoprotei archaeon]|nr:MAG: hypothetical protein DRN15_09020 [Thermoprotei archaeon]